MAIADASFTSALLNRADTHHAVATAWYETARGGGERLTAPAILLPEMASALARSQGRPDLAAAAAVLVTRRRLVRIEPVTEDLEREAARLAQVHGLRGCDAVYVALALRSGEPLVTFDREQAARARAIITVIEPQ